MDTKTIRKACEIAGGISALARKIGVKPPTVHQWVTGDRPVPAKRAPQIEKATGGAVLRESLCPDVFGSPTRRRAEKAA